jgi:hypothetical protein
MYELLALEGGNNKKKKYDPGAMYARPLGSPNPKKFGLESSLRSLVKIINSEETHALTVAPRGRWIVASNVLYLLMNEFSFFDPN